MLCSFKVSNFLSFNDEQVLSMEAGKVRSNNNRVYSEDGVKLLKFLAIYGANGSGKSNLVSALGFAQDVITRGLPRNCGGLFCRIDADNADRPSKFEFTIKILDKKFIYGFSVILNRNSFVSEWLYEITKSGVQKTVFSRNVCEQNYIVDTYFKDEYINSRLKIYAEDIKADSSALFLKIMNQNKGSLYEQIPQLKIYKVVYMWFKFGLSINYPDSPVTNYPYIAKNDCVDDVNKLLELFGTGISKLKFVDVPTEKVISTIPKELLEHITDSLHDEIKKGEHDLNLNNNLPSIMLRADDNTMFIIEYDGTKYTCKTIEFEHKNTDALFALSEESEGTIRLLDLIEVLLCKDPERVFVIDEINRRLHPLLTYKFVEEYLELAAQRNIQLIVTTHESKLMDFNLLRKDEIGFVNKDKYGVSSYYSMKTYGDRFDKKVRTAYFKGEYGAIPVFEN